MSEGTKKQVRRRVNIIAGQLHGLQKMLENGTYCVDVLHQSSAIKQGISALEDLILDNHLSTHVIEQMKSGKEAKSVREILDIYKLSKKK